MTDGSSGAVSELSPRRLDKADAGVGFRLSAEAGWNQIELDWKVMIRMGEGIGLVDEADRLIATSILIPYFPRVDWVSMVLVDSGWRRRGIGSRLMRLVMGLSPNPILGLDATEEGIPLYQKLGFAASEGITRYERPRRAGSDVSAVAGDRRVTPISAHEFRELTGSFAPDIGKRRKKMLEKLDPTDKASIRLVRDKKTVAIASVRPGRTSAQIGPIMAADAATAASLLRSVSETRNEALVVDVPDRHWALVAQLSEMGFKPSRHLTRMFRGGMPPSNPCEYAIVGPEFG
jgi:GNAT superfamily N-acetyltransferase